MMDPVKNGGPVHTSKSNNVISYVDNTNTDQVSKKKEDELLYGADDDEGTLSDDSLRLRLSDDDDAEQEAQVSKDVIVEEKLSCNPQQIMEEVIGSDSKKLTQKESKLENSASPSDEYTAESQSTKDDEHYLENSSTDILTSESNERRISNIHDKVKSDCHEKQIVEVTNIIKNKIQVTDVGQDKNIDDVEILNNGIKRKNNEVNRTFNSTKELKVNEVNNENINAVYEQQTLENGNLSVNNHKSNNQNAELKIHHKYKLKEAINEFNEINSTDICKVNNFDTVNSNSLHLDSAKSKSDKNEKSSTNIAIPENCDDKSILGSLIDEVIINAIQCPKRPLVEINNSQNSMNSVRSNNIEDMSLSLKEINENKKKKNVEYEDLTQSTNISKTQAQNQNDSFVVKNRTEAINEEYDFNKASSNILDDNSTSTNSALLTPDNVEDINNENRTKNTSAVVQKRKRAKKCTKLDINAVQNIIGENKQDGKESTRQKRKTARNAEEIIRRKYLNSDSDSSDEEMPGTLNHKLNQDVGLSSAGVLKRNTVEHESLINGVAKKAKISNNPEEAATATNDVTKLAFVEKICQRNIKDKLPKFTQEQLEELLIQKIVETITMRSEIGQLREQARVSEKIQEMMRTKLQQLTKQVKDFEMVLTRNATDRRANPDKFVAPIKINRSVGLQVNFITEQGMQTLQQMQQKSANTSSNSSSSTSEPSNNTAISSSRRGIKIRSPRRSEAPTTASTPTISQNSMQTPTTSLISTVTPAALVVAKPLESQHTLTLPNQPNTVQQLLTAPLQSIQQSHPAIVLNGKIQNQANRSPHPVISKLRNNDLIDLTDEEEKNKSATVNTTQNPLLEQQQLTVVTTKSTQYFPRVIQTIPTNVAITTQPPNIRMVQPNQTTPTALVNNTSPRLTYVMQSAVGAKRQLLITPNANQIRPVTRVTAPFTTVPYKTGSSTIANETVRVLTTPAMSNMQMNKHPAPLPDTPTYASTPGWKLPPPAPSLKMSKVQNGIVLSWNMKLTDKYAEIASYQLYAYQEVAGVNPSTSLWKKVGDVRALPLPMACTLTQFSEGNNYYFAVRAVDTHSRKGQYSIPGNISL